MKVHPPSLLRQGLALLVGMLAFATVAKASVEDALSFAYEAALPYHKQYSFRKDAWGGDLGVGERVAVTAQLFKGNQYWFILGSEVKTAVISVHIYDETGTLAETSNWQKPNDKKHFSAAGAYIVPKNTGTYFAIVQIHQSPEERTHWALVYGYKDKVKK